MRVRFVGNSYTMYHDVPRQVASLLSGPDEPVVTTMFATGGHWLRDHLADPKCVAAVAAADYDVLVIQEQSTRPLHNRDDFLRDVVTLGDLAGAASPRPVLLFTTWARKVGHEVYHAPWSGGSPEAMRKHLADAYREAAEALVARGIATTLAPVGAAFEIAIKQVPDVDLYDEDLHHASPAGGHLAARVLAQVLAGGRPLSPEIEVPIVTESVQRDLAAVAAQVV